MKVTIVICALIAIAQAEIDWSTVKQAQLIAPNVIPLNFKRIFPEVRITGGQEVDPPHSLPYQVALLIPTDEGTAFCGGSLLSPTTVLTAAHCAELSDNILVILGAHNVREEEPTQVRVNASQVTVHPEWNRLLLLNDLAILRLPEPVELNENINVVKLPTQADVGNTYEGDSAIASGWGKSSDAATTISDVLNEVEVPVAGNAICGVYYLGVIQDTHICTSGDLKRSTCSGDSGGPLVVDGTQVGITSFGISFGCEIGWPAVFTRVTSYLDWIAENSDVVIN